MDDAAMVDYLLRSARAPRPAAAVDRDAAARVHPGAARRPHASRRGDRADLDARRARGSPNRRSATRRSGSTTSGRASTCRAGSRSCSRSTRARVPCCSRSTGSSRGARRARRATRRRSSSSRAPRVAIDDAAHGRFGLGGRRSRSSAKGRAPPSSSQSLPALRGALLADADGARARGRPESGGSRVRVRGADARGQPDRRAVPRPSDQHEAQAARRRLRPGASTVPPSLPRAFRRGVEEYAAWYRDYYERNLDDETRQFPIDPAGRASSSSPASASSPRAGRGRARVARDLYHRAIAVERRRRRARRLPLAQRERRRSRSSTGRSSATSSRRRRRAVSSPAGSR